MERQLISEVGGCWRNQYSREANEWAEGRKAGTEKRRQLVPKRAKAAHGECRPVLSMKLFKERKLMQAL
eukprot:6212581-Pleurochrysis_carterae.AAC.6